MSAKRQRNKRQTRPIHIVLAAVMVAAIGGFGWQIYKTVTTPPEIAVSKPPASDVQQQDYRPPKDGDQANTQTPDADTPEIQNLKSMQPVDIETLDKTDNRVFFRTESALVYCEINNTLAEAKGNDWLMPYLRDGGVPAGAGVLCNQLRFDTPTEDETQACDGSQYQGGVAAVWADGVGYGHCHSGHTTLQQDGWDTDGNDTEAKSATPAIPLRHSVQFGDYMCGNDTDNLVCANLKTGHGFEIGALSHRTF